MLLTVVVTSAIRNEVLTGNTNVINWDGYGYYVYLPAVFVYGDVTDYAFTDEHFEQYDISSTVYQLMETEEGGKFPIYNIGLALVWAPAFLITHAVVAVAGIAPADGMSYPYQLAVVLVSWLIFWIGLVKMREFLLRYFSDAVVALTLVGVGLGTNLFYYAVEKPDMTHAYLFTGYAFFLNHFVKILDEEETNGAASLRSLLGLGLIAGILCLVRSSEIVVFAIPALYGLRNRTTLLRNFRRTLVVFLVTAALFAAFQLGFYRVATGAWFRDGYAGLSFDWTSPHLLDGLFSYRRGWLVYTPLMVMALLGIFRLRNCWLLPILVFTVANLYLLFSWHIWWYGNTFGSRPVVQSYAVLALPLAAFLAWVLGMFNNFSGAAAAGARKGRKAMRWGGLLLLPFILLNLFQHWQYNQRIIPLDFTNKTYYWHVFGKTRLNPKDRVYLDTDEKLPPGNHHASLLLRQDSLPTVPPKDRREFTDLLTATPARPPGEIWIRSHLTFAYHGERYDKWKFPSVVTEHRRGDETLKWVQVKIPPVLESPTRDSLSFALSLPDFQQGDVLKQYVWNLSQDSMTLYHFQADLILVE